MLAPPTAPLDAGPPPGDRAAALARLREAPNPFAFTVAAAGTDADCVAFNVPDLFRDQLADLKAIIEQYRRGRPQTRVFPVIGDTGAGKTHLLSLLRAALRREAESGSESLLVVGDYFSLQADAGDFLLWQMVNHLRDLKGPGHRLLQTVAARLTGRLLAEAIRRLPPPSQADLIPSAGFVERLLLSLGSGTLIERKRDAARGVVDACDAPDVTCDLLRAALRNAGLSAEAAERLLADHVAATEPNDAAGWVRRQLFPALTRIALRDDWEAFDAFHDGGFQEGPAHVTDAGRPARRLLVSWIDLLDRLHIPVILVFDQLEDFLRAETREKEQELRRLFTQAVVSLANAVADVCILLFAEGGLWNDVLRDMDRFSSSRFYQEFSLPGKPSQRDIIMPTRLPVGVVRELISARLRFAAPNFDFSTVPPDFPFGEARLRDLEHVSTPRDCLRKLSDWYNEIVYVDPRVVRKKLRQALQARWDDAVTAVRTEVGDEGRFNAAMIPELQAALNTWLRALRDDGITGAAVELLTDERYGAGGYWNVIRTGRPDEPGICVAAWLAGGKHKLLNLQGALGLFDGRPVPIRTLVLFHKDGEAALGGMSRDAYQDAVGRGRDVRVMRLEPRHLHAALAFPSWHQSAGPQMEAAGGDADQVYREVLADISRELLGWIEDWQRPRPGAPT